MQLDLEIGHTHLNAGSYRHRSVRACVCEVARDQEIERGREKTQLEASQIGRFATSREMKHMIRALMKEDQGLACVKSGASSGGRCEDRAAGSTS